MNYKRALMAAMVAMVVGGCGGKEDRISQHMERGTQHLTAGEYDKARVEFKNVLQIDPKNVSGMVGMARTLEKLDDRRNAATFYQAAIDADATQTDAKTRLARLYVTNGGIDQASKLVDELLAIDQNNDTALAIRGAVKTARGDKIGAEADARAALMRDPDTLEAVMLLASILNRSQRGDEAVTLLRSAHERHPKDLALLFALGDTYQKLGLTDEAAAQLQAVVAVEPTQLSHRIRLAKYHAANKNADEAETVLRDAVKAIPESTDAKLALIEYLVSTKGVEEGKRQLDEYAAAEPEKADIRFGQARLYAAMGKGDEAKNIYRRVIESKKVEPDGLRARSALARQLIGEGAVDQSLPLLDEVLKENPKDRDALLLRGGVALQRNDAGNAIADFRAVLRDDPASVLVLKALARAHRVAGEFDLAKDTYKKALSVDGADVESRVELAELYDRTKMHSEAASELETAHKLAPADPVVMDKIFKSYIADKQWDQAQAIATQWRARDEKSGAADFLDGLLAQAQGKTAQAEKSLRAALELNPKSRDVIGALVRLLADQKRSQDAVALLDQAVRRDPKDINTRLMKGELALAMGKQSASSALAEANEIVALDSKNESGYRLLALARMVQEDWSGAAAAYRKGIDATNGSLSLQLALANLYERRNQNDDAIALYEQMLKSHPDADLAKNNLAMLLAAYRSDDASIKRAAELIDPLRNSVNPAVLDTVGWVDYRRGQFAAAVPSLEKALKTAPDSVLVRYHLGMAQFKQGNRSAAKEHLQQALAGDAKFLGRDEAEKTLNSLAQM